MSVNEENSPAWRPDPGDHLVGTIAEFKPWEGKFGAYNIVVVDTDDGLRAVHAFHVVIREQFRKFQPRIGERIDLAYDGLITPKSGGDPYHGYTLVMPDRPPLVPDWGLDPSAVKLDPEWERAKLESAARAGGIPVDELDLGF